MYLWTGTFLPWVAFLVNLKVCRPFPSESQALFVSNGGTALVWPLGEMRSGGQSEPRTHIANGRSLALVRGLWSMVREEMLFIGIQMEDQVWSPAQLSPLKDALRECLFSWYAFLCFNGLENFEIFYIRHNNIHGNDLLDSSVENLHLVCYTES